MSSHRYRRVDNRDDDDDDEDDERVVNDHTETSDTHPSSPPPSFHSQSRSASPSSRLISSYDPLDADGDPDRTLADTFGDDDDESDDEDEVDERQRFMRGSPSDSGNNDPSSIDTPQQMQSQTQDNDRRGGRGGVQRTFTTLPAFAPSTSATSRLIHDSHDGVFANMAAKPERGEKVDDLPPTYEQAAADATPPYWETTIVAPGMSSDEVYVDGLPVGSFFSFIWNGMISASFQFVGFFLTYLLHTTHAAKNGSRAGLGLTMIQYGFYMRGGGGGGGGGESGGSGSNTGGGDYGSPPDPNNHDFNPESVHDGSYQANDSSDSSGLFADMTTSEWISYILMIVGWFILIRALSDYLRARRHEQLVLHSPDRGLPVPVIAEGERTESVV